MDIKKLSNKELKEQATSYYSACYGDNACYGTKDLMYLNDLLVEVDRRGLEVKVNMLTTI